MSNTSIKALEIKTLDLTSISDMHFGHVRAILSAIEVMAKDAANAPTIRRLAACGNWVIDALDADTSEFCDDIVSISKELH